MIDIQFWTIDDWNRPVFKSASGQLYGSLDRLFKWGETEEKVLETVNENDITWFGFNIDDDPMGSPCCVRIITKDQNYENIPK